MLDAFLILRDNQSIQRKGIDMAAENKGMTNKEIAQLKREYKEIKQKYERLRAYVGYDDIQGWEPKPDIERMYGFIHAWLYPLNALLNKNLGVPITPYLRNEIISTISAIISQMAISDKYGIMLPFEPKAVDIENFQEKQVKYYELKFDPCQICGETKITHQCHIIPRSEGGPNNRENFVTLCPLHHHLFDNYRLNKEEWEILKKVIETKMESARIYALEVRLRLLENYWTNPDRTYIFSNKE